MCRERATTMATHEFGDSRSTDLIEFATSELQLSPRTGMNRCQPIRYGRRATLSGIASHAMLNENCCLTRQNFLFNVGKIPHFFVLMMRDRFLPQYMKELRTKESLH
jgi:hypothetical protein